MSAGFGIGLFEMLVLVGIGLTGLLVLSVIAASATSNRRARGNDYLGDDGSSFSSSSAASDPTHLWSTHDTPHATAGHHEAHSGGYDAGLADGGSSDTGGSSDSGCSSGDSGCGGSSD